ncbi:hypothetical protein B0H12DRAFT_1236971 [Mycena haematopus]|nr:hypothetical protein B0H12DRAFT_1236971 [Mycena haematopus]
MAAPKKSRGGRSSRGAPSGRGHKPAGTKRSAPADSDYEDGSAPKKPRNKTADTDGAGAGLEVHETADGDGAGLDALAAPLQRKCRANTGKNMAALVAAVQPRAKRTPTEVLAAKTQQAESIAERERRRQQLIDEIAELDASQEKALADEEANAIYHLDDLSEDVEADAQTAQYDENELILEVTEEDFERIDNDDGSEYEEVAELKVREPAVTLKKRKKPAKFETRREIEEATKRKMVADGKKKAGGATVDKKGVQNSDAAAASNKAGLSKAWKKQALASSVNATLGGLTDEDVGTARPDFDRPENTLAPRKNTLVKIVDLSSDTEETPSKAPQTMTIKPTRKSRVVVKVEPSKIPALGVKSKTPKSLKTESSSSSFTPPAAADVNGLPAFIGRTWVSRFLPAVYRALFNSPDPLVLGVVGTDPEAPGKETVAILQKILNEVYPDTEYVLQWGDAICSRAVARIGERRSAIGRAGMQVVDRGFEGLKYYADLRSETPGARLSNVIASDAKYAIRQNGPAFYKFPTPEHLCQLKPGNPAYMARIKPAGYLESRPVIATISSFIEGIDWQIVILEDADGKELVDCSRLPVGLLGMAAAAVERGYKLHVTGVRAPKPLDFSAAHYGTAVAGFIEGIKKFKASRWQSILDACGATVSEPPAQDAADDQDDSLDGVREYMYIPSSPF